MTTATARSKDRALVWHPARSPFRDSTSAETPRRLQCRPELSKRLYRFERRRGWDYVPMDLYLDAATAEDHFQFAPVRVRSERRRGLLGRRFMV